MPSIFSTRDYAHASLWPGFVLNTKPAARGFYEDADAFHPTVARAWLSNNTGASFSWVVDFGAGALPVISSFAALDVRGYEKGAGQVASVALGYGTAAGGPFTTVVLEAVDSRGDLFAFKPSNASLAPFPGTGFRYWSIDVLMADGTDYLRVGKFWLGNLLLLPKTFAELAEAPRRNSAVQKTEGGAAFVQQLSDLATTVKMGWGRLKRDQKVAVRGVVDAVSGPLLPLVVRPDAREAAFYHGRLLSDSFETSSDGMTHGGAALELEESGRGI